MKSTDPTGVFAFTTWQQRVGIEREYKWSFPSSGISTILGGRTVPERLVELTLPDGYRRQPLYWHRQETAYLDDNWRLLDHESSLAMIINKGRADEQTYLKAKQTIGWHGQRRDAVEIAEKVDPGQVPLAVGERPALPVQYLSRQYADGLELRPFAITEQERWKLNIFSPGGTPMVLCWDECLIRTVDSAAQDSVHCIEVETNMLDEPAGGDLERLAGLVSELLGAEPNKLSKSRRGAALCGRPVQG